MLQFFPGYAIILLLMLGLPKEVTYMKEAIHPKYEETTITWRVWRGDSHPVYQKGYPRGNLLKVPSFLYR